MVLLIRGKVAPFDECWLINPLADLNNQPRFGVWEWRGRQDAERNNCILSHGVSFSLENRRLHQRQDTPPNSPITKI